MITVIAVVGICAAIGVDPERMAVADMASTLARTDSEQKSRQILRDCLQQHDNKAILSERSMESSPFVFALWWRMAKKSRMQVRNAGEPAVLSMFLTDVETRLGVSAPSEWRKALLNSKFSDEGILHTGVYSRQTQYSITGDVLVSKGLKYVEDRDTIELYTCEGLLAVPLHSAERNGVKLRRHYSVIQKDSIAFLFEFTEFPLGYNLSAWDCAKRVQLWKVYGRGTYREEIGTRPFHDASIVSKDGNVYVFGRSGRDVYIAAWQCATGERIFEWSAVFGDE